MTSVLADLHGRLQQTAFDMHRAAIARCTTLVQVDNRRELVDDARGLRRLSYRQWQTLVAELVVRREEILGAGWADTFRGELCRRCDVWMQRTVQGDFTEDGSGRFVTREEDVCPCCGAVWPIVGDVFDLPEVRDRVFAVVTHRKVTDHRNCGPEEPCNATRPGLRHLQVVSS